MTTGTGLGTLLAWRTRGREYIELFRVWVLPVVGTASGSKYVLGLSGWKALAVGVAVPLVLELGATIFGWLDMRSGAGLAHQAALNELDPWKKETLGYLRALYFRSQRPAVEACAEVCDRLVMQSDGDPGAVTAATLAGIRIRRLLDVPRG